MGNEDYIVDELVTLLRAGITRDDIYKLYKYRNYGAKDYDGKYTQPEYRTSQGSYIWPTQGTITSHFGYRDAPTAGASSNHQAIDIGAPQGTPVVAADGGVVIEAGSNGGYGNSVGVRHDDGTISYYNHLYSWGVKVGDKVSQGQQIGQVGSTGISTGPHLDFRLYKDGEYLDPEQYLQG
jgi:murein DD-endopeptidase MepM/ murein hydrolase activator NlpD